MDLNPVRAGLVAQPEAWPWSSARSRILGGPDPLLAPDCPILEAVESGDWRAFLETGLPDEALDALRRHERTDRPLGSEVFVQTLGRLLGRNLTLHPPGQKPLKEKQVWCPLIHSDFGGIPYNSLPAAVEYVVVH